MAKRYPHIDRIRRKVGAEKTIEGILMLEQGESKSNVASFWGVSNSYMSGVLKDIGPPVITYRIPASLLGLKDSEFTDDLGPVSSHRPGHDTAAFQALHGYAPLNAKHNLTYLRESDQRRYDAFCLNTQQRASMYAAHIESVKFEGNTDAE